MIDAHVMNIQIHLVFPGGDSTHKNNIIHVIKEYIEATISRDGSCDACKPILDRSIQCALVSLTADIIAPAVNVANSEKKDRIIDTIKQRPA